MTTIVQSSNEDDDLCKFDESDKFTFVWKISNLKERIGDIESKEFTIKGPGCKISSWSVKVHYDSRRGKCSVYLQNLTDEDIFINCTVSTMCSGDNVKRKRFGLEMCEVKSKNRRGSYDLFQGINSGSFFHNGTLIIEMTVLEATKKSVEAVHQCSIEGEVLNHCNKYDALSKNYHQGQLSQDLELLFTSNEYADITIVCGDKTFKCHKIILASRSPVFKTMFDADMKEKEAGSVEIKNMTPEVLENMLKYMYTCEAPDIDALTVELLAAAEQYQLDKLKILCEVKLCSKIEVVNCIELLVLAELHGASTLKITALKYVANNIGNMNSSEWKKTLITYPTLLVEVMEMMLPKNNF